MVVSHQSCRGSEYKHLDLLCYTLCAAKACYSSAFLSMAAMGVLVVRYLCVGMWVSLISATNRSGTCLSGFILDVQYVCRPVLDNGGGTGIYYPMCDSIAGGGYRHQGQDSDCCILGHCPDHCHCRRIFLVRYRDHQLLRQRHRGIPLDGGRCIAPR